MIRLIKSKYLILPLIFLFSFLSVHGIKGNEEEYKRFQLSLYLGTNFSNFGGDPLKFVESLNTATGYTFDQKKKFAWPFGCIIKL